MNINWLESLLYGFISGLAEFLPISAQAHQTILAKLFGLTGNSAFINLWIHCGMLLGLYVATREHLWVLYREMRLAAVPKRRRRREPDAKSIMQIKLIKTAFWLMAVCFIFYPVTRLWQNKIHIVGLLLIVNGLIIIVPQFLFSGNKDARRMSAADGILLGLANGLFILPGISRIAISTTVSHARGVERTSALNWALCLSIPALAFLIGFDIYSIIFAGTGVNAFVDVIKCLLAAASAYLGSYLSITVMRFISVHSGYYAFGYYSWGAALFAFILFLTI